MRCRQEKTGDLRLGQLWACGPQLGEVELAPAIQEVETKLRIEEGEPLAALG